MCVPHILIEYSANVAQHHDIDALVTEVHRAALTDGLAAADALRTRAMERQHYRVADGQTNHAFVAIVARIGPGRQAEAKTRFLNAVLDAAEGHISREATPLAIAWSAEIQEIDADFRINRNYVRARLQADAPSKDAPPEDAPPEDASPEDVAPQDAPEREGTS